MLRLRSPHCLSTAPSSAAGSGAPRALRPAARPYSQQDAPAAPAPEPRAYARPNSGDVTSRLDFGHRAPRSQFGRNSQRSDGDFDAAPGRFDRDQGSSGRSFGNRGRGFGDQRGERRFGGGGGSRMEDKAFYSQPLSKDEQASDAPYQRPTPKFNTKPNWASDAERSAWLSQHAIRMFGNDAPAPIRTWEEVGLPQEFMRALTQFAAPTLIQSIALPIALSGRDMIGIAETGSGKTLAFAIPALASFFGETIRPRQPRVVVLAPTRELAVQTAKVFDALGAPLGVRTACVYGGASARNQIDEISRGAGVIVATPGRLTDLVRSGHVSLSKVTYGVLDEADRMLDMGFAPQIDTILQAFPRQHQTLMFSATWPTEIRSLANQYLRDGIRVQIGSEEMLANPRIKQVVEVMPEVPTMDQRLQKLHDLMHLYHVPAQKKNKIIVFVNTKVDADLVVDYLSEKSFRASALHGDYSQAQRDRAMHHFKEGRVPILVATDVAARGLDVADVEYVINLFFPPGDIDQYVHRIGRTGRAGNNGVAHTIFTPVDAQKKNDLVDILDRAKQQIPPELLQIRGFGGGGGRGRGRGGGRSSFGGGGRGGGGRGGGFRSNREMEGGGQREWSSERRFPPRDRNFGAEQKL